MALSTLHAWRWWRCLSDCSCIFSSRALNTKVQKHHKQSVRRRQFVCQKPETGSDSKATRFAKMPSDDGGRHSLTVSSHTPATLSENVGTKLCEFIKVKVNNLQNWTANSYGKASWETFWDEFLRVFMEITEVLSQNTKQTMPKIKNKNLRVLYWNLSLYNCCIHNCRPCGTTTLA